MKKSILLLALAFVSCEKADIKPNLDKGKLPDPQVYEIVWFDHWNMDKIEMRYVDLGKIKGDYPTVDVIIVGDDGTETNLNEGGAHWWNAGKLWLMCHDEFHTDGIFDNTNYDDTTVLNRGYILIY